MLTEELKPPVYTLRQFALELDCSARTVRRWVKQGKVTPFKRIINGQLLFSQEEVEKAKAYEVKNVRTNNR
jgi:DNA-binding transcriptional MerR regulator